MRPAGDRSRQRRRSPSGAESYRPWTRSATRYSTGVFFRCAAARSSVTPHLKEPAMRTLAAAMLVLGLAVPSRAVTNTAQDATTLSFVACNGRVGFRTSETQQGQTDLNG